MLVALKDIPLGERLHRLCILLRLPANRVKLHTCDTHRGDHTDAVEAASRTGPVWRRGQVTSSRPGAQPAGTTCLSHLGLAGQAAQAMPYTPPLTYGLPLAIELLWQYGVAN